jgi:hypothetical protein
VFDRIILAERTTFISYVSYHPHLTRRHRRIFRVFLPRAVRLSLSGVSSRVCSAQHGCLLIRRFAIHQLYTLILAGITILVSMAGERGLWPHPPQVHPPLFSFPTTTLQHDPRKSLPTSCLRSSLLQHPPPRSASPNFTGGSFTLHQGGPIRFLRLPATPIRKPSGDPCVTAIFA